MYTDATFSKGVITAYGSTTDISSNLGPCVHSGYGVGLQITNADNQTVVGQDFGETINVNEAINDIFGEYSPIGTATGDGGLYQVNVQVPAGVTPGSAAAVVVSIGGAQSNVVTLAIQ